MEHLLAKRFTMSRTRTHNLHYLPICNLNADDIFSLEERSAALSELILVSSHWIKSTLTELSVPESKFRQIPYAVDLPAYRKAAAVRFPHRAPGGKKVIAFTGRLEYIKGVHVLIKALASLKKTLGLYAGLPETAICWKSCVIKLPRPALRSILYSGVSWTTFHPSSNMPIFMYSPAFRTRSPFPLPKHSLREYPLSSAVQQACPKWSSRAHRVGRSPQDADSLSELLHALLEDDATRRRVGAAAKSWAEQHRSLEEMGLHTLHVYQEAIYRGGLQT